MDRARDRLKRVFSQSAERHQEAADATQEAEYLCQVFMAWATLAENSPHIPPVRYGAGRAMLKKRWYIGHVTKTKRGRNATPTEVHFTYPALYLTTDGILTDSQGVPVKYADLDAETVCQRIEELCHEHNLQPPVI